MKAKAPQYRIPLFIARGTIPARMDFAVDLDREARGKASEIEAVVPDGVLTPEFEAAGPGFQRAPQDNFGRVAASAFFSGERYRFA